MVKNLLAMQVTWVQSLGWDHPLEKEVATHSSIFAWRIPWTEEPGGLQSMGLQRVRHNWATNTYILLYFLFQNFIFYLGDGICVPADKILILLELHFQFVIFFPTKTLYIWEWEYFRQWYVHTDTQIYQLLFILGL